MARPNVVTVARATIAYTDTTSVSLGFLPPNATVIGARVLVTTAFNGSTTDVIDIGVNGTANNIADDVDVSSTGSASVTLGAAAGATQSTTDPTEITAIYVDGASDSSAGSAEVIVEYTFKE